MEILPICTHEIPIDAIASAWLLTLSGRRASFDHEIASSHRIARGLGPRFALPGLHQGFATGGIGLSADVPACFAALNVITQMG